MDGRQRPQQLNIDSRRRGAQMIKRQRALMLLSTPPAILMVGAYLMQMIYSAYLIIRYARDKPPMGVWSERSSRRSK